MRAPQLAISATGPYIHGSTDHGYATPLRRFYLADLACMAWAPALGPTAALHLVLCDTTQKNRLPGLVHKMSLQCSPNSTLSPGAQHIPNADTNLNGCRNAAHPPAPADARGSTRSSCAIASLATCAAASRSRSHLGRSRRSPVRLDGILFWILVDLSIDHSAGRRLSGSVVHDTARLWSWRIFPASSGKRLGWPDHRGC